LRSARFGYGLVFLINLLVSQLASAQVPGGPILFQENKGQWDPVVKYRAEVQAGYVFLRKDGFTYSLLDQQDMDQLETHFHGTPVNTTGNGNNGAYIIGPGHHPDNKNMIPAPPANTGENAQAPAVIHGHAYQINFLGAHPDPEMITDHAAAGSYNYLIGNDKSKWGKNVRAYGGVTYKSVYDDIDARIYSNASQLKYDFIVYPGGDPGQIRLQYKGVDKLEIKKGQLYIQTSIGEVIEVAPYAYQIIDNEKKEVSCTYKLKGDVLTFKVGSDYQAGSPLIIDPYIVFATFSGAKGDNWGYTATYDAQGNFYMAGIIFGQTGTYPATTGAYQTTFGGGTNYSQEGGFDISISKFDPLGRTLMYATYLGGSGDEQPHSLIVDGKGDLIVSGRTNNATTYPHSKLVGTAGNWDMVVTELNPSGSDLVGSLVIGGTGADGVNIAEKYQSVNGKTTYSLRRFYGDDARSEVNIGPDGNIYVVSCTQSVDFPMIGSGFQTSKGGGQDGVILKIQPDVSDVIWSTYLGGKGDDACFVVNFGDNGNVYVAGGTASSDFPMKGSPIQGTFGGGACDGFIVEVSPDGSSLVRSTFLGTAAADQIYGIQLDDEGNVYVTGTTEGIWTVTDNAKYPGINVNGKQFISKLPPTLSSYIYSTVFGATNATAISLPNISPTAFLVDRCENVYVAGWGGMVAGNEYPNSGTANMPVKNPIHPTPPDGRDFYFFVLKKDATDILFADTYGQNGGSISDHVDGGTSRFDRNGVIYEAICGNCGGDAYFPTGPPGVYSPSNQSGGRCNEAGLKIAFNLDGIRGGAATIDRRKNYCVGEQVGFIDTLYGRTAKQWIWNVYDTCDINAIPGKSPIGHEAHDSSMQNAYEFYYDFPHEGCYTVQLIKYLPNECVEYDTSYVSVRIASNPAMVTFSATKLKPCDSYRYHFENLSSNEKGLPFDDKAFVWDFGDGSAPDTTNETAFDHTFPGEGSYTVHLRLVDTANFCNTPIDTVKILSLSNELKASMQLPDTLCAPQQVVFQNTSLGGTNFTWYIQKPFNGGIDSFHVADLSPLTYTLQDSGWYDIKLYAIDTVCGQEDVTEDSVLVYPTPLADFTFSPNNATNQVIHFINQSSSGFQTVDTSLTYHWDFGDSFTSMDRDPQHLYAKTGDYQTRLYVVNKAGCMDTVTKTVSETIVPDMDMPNAFTPNGDGNNDYIAPRAFGVDKIDFRIYNRWGQMVFQSTDPAITYIMEKGWNGKYQGKPQEMDVYAYVLNIVFNDGTKATKQGSITLIR